MTERAQRRPVPAKRPRYSKAVLRGWAWILGLLAFFLPWAAFGAAPKPLAEAATASPPPLAEPPVIQRGKRLIIVRHHGSSPTAPVAVSSAGTSNGATGGS